MAEQVNAPQVGKMTTFPNVEAIRHQAENGPSHISVAEISGFLAYLRSVRECESFTAEGCHSFREWCALRRIAKAKVAAYRSKVYNEFGI